MRMCVLANLAAAGSLLWPVCGEAGTDFGRVSALVSEAANDNAASDLAPTVATDGNGVWLATWLAYPGGTLGITGDGAPVYTRSLDDGESWSPLALVRPEAAADSAAFPTVATDTHGKWILVWGAGTHELRATVSTDNGQAWGSPTVIVTSNAFRVHSNPMIETDRSGTWVVAWRSDDSLGGSIGEDGDILFSRSVDDGGTWSAAAPLNTTAATDGVGELDLDVRIATDHAGTWMAVWATLAQAWYARSIDNGATWSAPAAFSHVGFTGSTDPSVATDDDGRWIAVWSNTNDGIGGYDDHDIWFSTSSDNGATWSAQSRLHPYMVDIDDGPDISPGVTSSGAGQWSVAWTSSDDLRGTTGSDSDIEISTSRDSGLTWSAPAALVSRARVDGTATDFMPELVSSPTGQSLVLWSSRDSLEGTIGDDLDILYAAGRRDCAGVARVDCSATTRPRGSALTIKDKNGGADRLRWRWSSGEETTDADLGDPTAADSYVACLYEKVGGVSGLIGEWDARAAGTCSGLACWTKSPGDVTYTDLAQESGSIKRLRVRARTQGGTRIRLQGFGSALAPPRLPLDVSTPVRIQLVNLGTGVCWEGVHSQAAKNDSFQFTSTSD